MGAGATKCGVRKKNGDPCGMPAGHGVEGATTGPCKHHGGALPVVKAKQARQELQAQAQNMATAVQLEPIDALLHVVYSFAGRAKYLAVRASVLEEAVEFDGDGRMHPVLVALRQSQLDLGRMAKLALDAGVAERRVQMAERTGALIGAAAEDALAAVGALEGAPAGVSEWLASAAARGAYARSFAASLSMLEIDGEASELP